MSIAVCVEIYGNGLSLLGTSLGAEAPMLKLLFFLPFSWLLLEGRKTSNLQQGAAAYGVS